MASESVIVKALEKVAHDEGFGEGKFKIKMKEEHEYLHAAGEMKFVISNDKGFDLHLLVTRPPSDPDTVFKIPTAHCHFNNVHFYTKVFPKIRNSGTMFTVPKYYGSSIVKDQEYLILEDVGARNYRPPPLGGLNHLHLSMTIKCLSEFNSMVGEWKKGNLQEFKTVCRQFKPIIGPSYPHKERVPVYVQLVKRILQASWVMTRQKSPSRLRGIVERLLREFPSGLMLAIEDTRDHSSLVNCALWTPNLLFRYHSITGSPIDVAVSDWSFARMGSPVLDLSFLILASVETKLYPGVVDMFKEYFTADLPYYELPLHLNTYGVYGVYGALFVNTIKAFEKTIDMNALSLGDLTNHEVVSEDVPDIRERIIAILHVAELLGF